MYLSFPNTLSNAANAHETNKYNSRFAFHIVFFWAAQAVRYFFRLTFIVFGKSQTFAKVFGSLSFLFRNKSFFSSYETRVCVCGNTSSSAEVKNAACVYFIADELIVKINKWNTLSSIELKRHTNTRRTRTHMMRDQCIREYQC